MRVTCSHGLAFTEFVQPRVGLWHGAACRLMRWRPRRHGRAWGGVAEFAGRSRGAGVSGIGQAGAPVVEALGGRWTFGAAGEGEGGLLPWGLAPRGRGGRARGSCSSGAVPGPFWVFVFRGARAALGPPGVRDG